MLVGTDVCIRMVFVWEETGVPGGNPTCLTWWTHDHLTCRCRVSNPGRSAESECVNGVSAHICSLLQDDEGEMETIFLTRDADCRMDNVSITGYSWCFFVFSVRLLSVLHAHSLISANDLRLGRIFYPRFYPLHLIRSVWWGVLMRKVWWGVFDGECLTGSVRRGVLHEECYMLICCFLIPSWK